MAALESQLYWAKKEASDVRIQQQFSVFREAGVFGAEGTDWEALHRPFFQRVHTLPLTVEARQDLIQRRYNLLFGKGGALELPAVPQQIYSELESFTPQMPGIPNLPKIHTPNQVAAESSMASYIVRAMELSEDSTTAFQRRVSEVLGLPIEQIFNPVTPGQFARGRSGLLTRLLAERALERNLNIHDTGITTLLAEEAGLDAAAVVEEVRAAAAAGDSPLSLMATRFREAVGRDPTVRQRLASGGTRGIWYGTPVHQQLGITREAAVERARAVENELLAPLMEAGTNLQGVAVPNAAGGATPLTWVGPERLEEIRQASLYLRPGTVPANLLRPFEFRDEPVERRVDLSHMTPQQAVDRYGARGAKTLTRMYAEDEARLLYDLGNGERFLNDAQREEIARIMNWQDAVGENRRVAVKLGGVYQTMTLRELMEGHRQETAMWALGREGNLPKEILDVINDYYTARIHPPLTPPGPALTAVYAAEQAVRQSAGKGPSAARSAILSAEASVHTGAARLGQVISGIVPESYDDVSKKVAEILHGPGVVIAGLGVLTVGVLSTGVGIKRTRAPYDVEYQDEVAMESSGEITNETLVEQPQNVVISGKIRARTKSGIDQGRVVNAIHSAIGVHLGNEPEKSDSTSDTREPITKRLAHSIAKRLFSAKG